MAAAAALDVNNFTDHAIEVAEPKQTLHYVSWPKTTTASPAELPHRPPIVCLHGMTQTCHSWDEYAAHASAKHKVSVAAAALKPLLCGFLLLRAQIAARKQTKPTRTSRCSPWTCEATATPVG